MRVSVLLCAWIVPLILFGQSGLKIQYAPDGVTYIGYDSGSNHKLIWTSTDGINWSAPYAGINKNTFLHVINDVPDEFSISDLKFNPPLTITGRESWNKEPLLSFYIWSNMCFHDSKNANMMVNDKIFETSDGGNHWEIAYPKDFRLFHNYGVDSILICDYKTKLCCLMKSEISWQDSLRFCKCKGYASTMENHMQIEDGTYTQTELPYLNDVAPVITLQDGKFLYNPKSFFKDSLNNSENMTKTNGNYIATENTITFSTNNSKSYFNGTFDYLFDGNNFWIYKCAKGTEKINPYKFYAFGKENVYKPPVVSRRSERDTTPHASGFIYSFVADSDKFNISLTDNKGQPVNNASLKLDDIYATPVIQKGKYYFDKRTVNEFCSRYNSKVLLVIFHQDYETMVVSFNAKTNKYILKQKKKT